MIACSQLFFFLVFQLCRVGGNNPNRKHHQIQSLILYCYNAATIMHGWKDAQLTDLLTGGCAD